MDSVEKNSNFNKNLFQRGVTLPCVMCKSAFDVATWRNTLVCVIFVAQKLSEMQGKNARPRIVFSTDGIDENLFDTEARKIRPTGLVFEDMNIQ